MISILIFIIALKKDSVKIMIEIVDSVIRNHANRTLNIFLLYRLVFMLLYNIY